MTVDKSTPEYLAAKKFFNLLGNPEEHLYAVEDWLTPMRDCMGESQLDLEAFYDFLRWAVKMNSYSAEYLRIASNPMASLKKNLPTLLKRYHAFQAALSAKAERDAIFSKAKPVPVCKCGRPKPCELHDLEL